jgi:ATP-dependent Clp protease ATP-binding subunit ClpB
MVVAVVKERIVLTDQSRHLFHSASANATRLGQASATAAHMLMAIEKQPPTMASFILDSIGIDVDELRKLLEAVLQESKAAPLPSEEVSAINERAQLNAKRLNSDYVSTEHVLLGCLQLPGVIVTLAFQEMGVPLEIAVARAEAITEHVALGKVLPKRWSPSDETI